MADKQLSDKITPTACTPSLALATEMKTSIDRLPIICRKA